MIFSLNILFLVLKNGLLFVSTYLKAKSAKMPGSVQDILKRQVTAGIFRLEFSGFLVAFSGVE